MRYVIIICVFIVAPFNIFASDIIIGTGSKKAVFYPLGSALCKVFNENQDRYTCEAITSKGSSSNLQNILEENITFGISQTSLQDDYYEGDQRLRSLFKLHDEHFSIIVKRDANIQQFSDLLGKRVNIGNIGSGSRIFLDRIMLLQNWNIDNFSEVYEESSGKISDLFCADKIDAAVYLVGHPNKAFMKMIEDCNGALVGFSKDEQARFETIGSDFASTVIFPGTYINQDKAIGTIGIPTILSTIDSTDPDVVYSFVKTIYSNREELVENNQIFRNLDIKINDTQNIAPLHESVEIYFE